MEVFRQEYWSGLRFLSAGDLPDRGIKPEFPVSPALADGFFITVPNQKMSLSVGKYQPYSSKIFQDSKFHLKAQILSLEENTASCFP